MNNRHIFLLFVFSTLILVSCQNSLEQINAIAGRGLLPDIAVENLETSYSENGFIKARITSPLVNKYAGEENSHIEFPKGVYVEFLDTLYQKTSTLKADYAIYYEKKQLWEARGNVLLTNEKGGMLQTEQLFGDEKAEKIYSTKFVKITDPDSTFVSGKGGFESNLKFTSYRFVDVSGSLYLHEEFIKSQENQ